MYIYSYSSHITHTCAEEGEDFYRLWFIYRQYSKANERRCGMNRVSSVRLRRTAAPQSRLYDSLKQRCKPSDSGHGALRQWLRSRIEDSYPQKDVGAVTSVLTSCRVAEIHSWMHNVFRCMWSDRSVMNNKVTSISLWRFLYQIFPCHVVFSLGPLGYLPPKVLHLSTHPSFSFLLSTIGSGF